MERELITLNEAARILGLDWATVKKMVDKGQLETVPVGDLQRVRRSQVLEIIQGSQEGAEYGKKSDLGQDSL